MFVSIRRCHWSTTVCLIEASVPAPPGSICRYPFWCVRRGNVAAQVPGIERRCRHSVTRQFTCPAQSCCGCQLRVPINARATSEAIKAAQLHEWLARCEGQATVAVNSRHTQLRTADAPAFVAIRLISTCAPLATMTHLRSGSKAGAAPHRYSRDEMFVCAPMPAMTAPG